MASVWKLLLLLLLLLFLLLCVCCLYANYFVVTYKLGPSRLCRLSTPYILLLNAPCNTCVCCKRESGVAIKRQPTRLITRFKQFIACFSQSRCCAPTATFIYIYIYYINKQGFAAASLCHISSPLSCCDSALDKEFASLISDN